MFQADSRIDVDRGAPLKGGESNELTLLLHGPPIPCIEIEETAESAPVDQTFNDVPVLRRSDGSQYVLFTPVRLGRVGVRLFALFPDGGYSRLETELDVEPSDREPAALILQLGGVPGRDNDLLRLGLNDPRWQSPNHWERLYPAAYYLDSKQPLSIDGSHLRFEVKQPNGEPIVELSEDGGIRPLRLGDALLTVTFGKTSRDICVQVRSSASAGDNSRCGELRPPPLNAPLGKVWTHDPDGLESNLTYPGYFVSRALVTPPSDPIALAQPVEIPVVVGNAKIRSIEFTERMTGSDASRVSTSFVFPSPPRTAGQLRGDIRFLREEGTSEVFGIIPAWAGEETIAAAVRFEDGGFDERYFHLKIVPSDKGLIGMNLDYWSPPNRRPRVIACLKYAQMTGCRPLSTLEGLNIQIEQPKKPVLRIDPNGDAHELSSGEATVIVSYGGVKQSLEVSIQEPLVP